MISPDTTVERFPRRRLVVAGSSALVIVTALIGVSSKMLRHWVGARLNSHPNVILISVDTLRADRLSLYGYYRPTTPHLQELAASGTVFERFYQNGGGTLESHLTMMTSLRPASHQVTSDNQRRLETERITLAEMLKQHGYATAGFTDNGWMVGEFGFSQGFDVYDDRGGGFSHILPRAHDWIVGQDEKPLFLFVHTYDVHSAFEQLPYDCPAGFRTRYTTAAYPGFTGCRNGRCASALLLWLNERITAGALDASRAFSPGEVDYMSALYDGCVAYADAEIGGFLEILQRRNLFDNSLIIVTSDHGEEFLDHGMFLHAQSAYEEFARVPLVVKLPAQQHAGTRITGLAAMIDVMPTILDRLGIPLPAQAQGSSLLPLIRSAAPGRDAVHLEDGIVTAHWKYIGHRNLLFDLKNDPRERLNVVETFPNLAHRLRARLHEMTEADRGNHAEFVRRVSRGPPVLLDGDQQERLRSLGYVVR